MADSKKGRRFHSLVETAREAGKLLKALEYSDQAILAYQKDGDLLGLAEVLASRQSTFKQLFRKTRDKVFLILEKYPAQASVEVAEKSGIKEALGIPYHNLGKYYFENGEYESAYKSFKKAVEYLTKFPGRHTRPSVIADIQGHEYAAKYFTGDKSSLSFALKALKALENAQEENSYNKNVWLSGGHIRIAKMLIHDNPKLAKAHLTKAEKIISSDKRLVLRKHEVEILKKKL